VLSISSEPGGRLSRRQSAVPVCEPPIGRPRRLRDACLWRGPGGREGSHRDQPTQDDASAGYGQHDQGRDAGMPRSARRPVVSTGNPRVTVAFPFSKVEIRDPPDAVRDLAAMVWRLAEQVAELAARRRLAGQRRRTAWPRRLADTRQPAQRDFPAQLASASSRPSMSPPAGGPRSRHDQTAQQHARTARYARPRSLNSRS
jgi:hypothetical protein